MNSIFDDEFKKKKLYFRGFLRKIISLILQNSLIYNLNYTHINNI